MELKDQFKIFYIGNNITKNFFNFVNCENLILTLTNIGNNYFKSVFVKIHLFFSLACEYTLYL